MSRTSILSRAAAAATSSYSPAPSSRRRIAKPVDAPLGDCGKRRTASGKPERGAFLRGARRRRGRIVEPPGWDGSSSSSCAPRHLASCRDRARHLLDERGDGSDVAEGRDGVVQEVRERLAGVRVRVGVRRHRVFVVFVFVVVVDGMAVGLADQDGGVAARARKARRSGSRKPSERDASRMRTAASRLASAEAPARTGRRSPVEGSTARRDGRSSLDACSGETPRRSAARSSRACEWTRYRASPQSATRCGVGEYTCAMVRMRSTPAAGAPPPILAGARAALLSWFHGMSDGFFERTDNSVRSVFFFCPQATRDPLASRKQRTSGKNRDYSPVGVHPGVELDVASIFSPPSGVFSAAT